MNLATSSAAVDWRAYPPTMRASHLAELYGYTTLYVKKLAQTRNPKIPTPCTARPWGWNRADVERHYSRRTA